MSAVAARLRDYASLMRIDRPIGTLLLLWPTLWALWFAAGGVPDLHILAVFVVGTFLMRSAGCVINDYADRDFDPYVARTRDRPLAARRITTREALVLFVVLSLVAFALVLTLNRLTILLAVAGAFLATSYPFLKRWTHLPQFYLGVAFGWGIPMAFAAQTNALPPLAWVVLAANICWAVAYDTAYAMTDRADDLKIGVKSTAILFGRHDRLMVGLFHAATLALLGLAGFMTERGILYYTGLAMAAALAVQQQFRIRRREPAECFRAFLENNRFGAVVFLGLALDYYVTGL
ncbi:MAG TPA: 4-hydroxybenzoate octaprenyltransferase [Burkholderiales bacterium]